MKESMRSKLAQLARRLEEIDVTLQDPDIASNMDRFRALSKERAEIEPIVQKTKEFEKAEADLEAANEMLSDPEMKEFASEEIGNAKKVIEQVSAELEILLLPKDPNDDKNIFLEIRAGTGGDESALFAGDLFRMYSRYAEARPILADTKKSLSESSDLAPIPSSNSKAADIAFSVFRKPSLRDASIRPHVQSRFFLKPTR